jgi:probable rRNA maturation factor
MKRSNAVHLQVERGVDMRGLARAEINRRIHAMIDVVQLPRRQSARLRPDLRQLKQIEVSFVLTDDERIHQLNKIYRHKDRPTDVLAFAMREGEFKELAGDVLGDVIVSIPTARKQAAAAQRAVLDEVTMLLAHGLLHLLGWDHQTLAEDKKMRAETDRLCQAAAVSKPSARRVSPSKPRVIRAFSKKRGTVKSSGRGRA